MFRSERNFFLSSSPSTGAASSDGSVTQSFIFPPEVTAATSWSVNSLHSCGCTTSITATEFPARTRTSSCNKLDKTHHTPPSSPTWLTPSQACGTWKEFDTTTVDPAFGDSRA